MNEKTPLTKLLTVMHLAQRYGSLLLKIVVSVALLAWLFYQIDFDRTAIQWQEAEWGYIILFGPPVFIACLFINILRWHLILVHQGFHGSLMNLAILYTRGAFLGSFLPGGATTGDIYRIHSLTKRTQDIDASMASVFFDRASGLFALLFLSLAALLYSLFEMNVNSFRPLLKPIIVVSLLFPASAACLFVLRQLFFHQANIRHPLLVRMRSFLDRLPDYLEDRVLVLKGLVLSVALQMVIVGWTYIVSRALNVNVPFLALLIAVPLIALLLLLPISLGGFGLRETGYVFFLVPFGLTPGEATSIGLVSVLVQTALRLISGVVVFWDPTQGSEEEVAIFRSSGTTPTNRLSTEESDGMRDL